MKKKVFNVAVCDVREVTEESLAGFDSITINAASIISNARSREILGRYPVTINAASFLEIPDGENIKVRTLNGSEEISSNSDGRGVYLLVNGKVILENGSLEAAKSFYRIAVNGKILMPKSFKGQLQNIDVNGKAEYYPDEAMLLKARDKIDDLFVMRASHSLYYGQGTLFFLDEKIDSENLVSKGIRFAAKKAVISEGLLRKLISIIDEDTELVRVPDGTKVIDDDLELNDVVIKKFGSKLYVEGDVSVMDGEVLPSLEYLYSEGKIRVDKRLKDKFESVDYTCSDVEYVDPDSKHISDRAIFVLSAQMLDDCAGGLVIEDCAKLKIDKDVKPEDILKKVKISDCAFVTCTKEQRDAVDMVSEDVARISTYSLTDALFPHSSDGDDDDFGDEKSSDTQVINATEYKL